MAEKPRLKKSDEILGSITAEPARTKRAGSRAPDQNGSQSNKGQEPKEKPAKDDFFEDDIELTDAPVLPSAQSLAEKLLPKKPNRQRDFGAFEPPKTGRSQAKPEAAKSAARTEPKAAAKSASIEFSAATDANNRASSAPVEFHSAPAPEKPATIEFDGEEEPEQAPPRQAAARQQQPRQEQPRQAQNRAAPSRSAPPPVMQTVQEFEATAPPTIAEYTFQSFEDTKAAEKTDAVWEFSTKPDGGQPRERASRGPEEQPPRRERIIRPLKTEVPAVPPYQPPEQQWQEPEQRRAPETDYEPTPAQEPEQRWAPEPFYGEPEQRRTPVAAYEPPPPPEISEAERNRQEFMKRIASQFEVQFEEKFEDGALRPRDTFSEPAAEPRRERPAPPREPLFPPREPMVVPEPKRRERPNLAPAASLDDAIDGEDFLAYVQRQERERKASGEADLRAQLAREREPERGQAGREEGSVLGFIEKFEQNIREEEHQRSEDFKETLSQKFMRERERYLKELEIDHSEPEPDLPVIEAAPAAPPRRRLDFQIQPEMHMQNGNLPQSAPPSVGNPRGTEPRAKTAGPVTYTRGGTVKSQIDEAEASVIGMALAPERAPAGKKTGEQLLMEHSKRARVPAQQPVPQPAKPLKFTFETPEERTQKTAVKGKRESVLPTEKWPRRIVFIAMAAGMVSLGLVVWSMVSYYNLSSRFSPTSESSAAEVLPVEEATIDVYNDRVFTQTATADNVFFKYAGTLLKNVRVKEHVVIENVEGTGRIRLEDVEVASAISVKSSASDTLELHNVKAERLIINNPQAGMTLSATGNTSIGVVELRTKSNVKQTDIGVDFDGIRGVVMTSPEAGGEIDTVLDGLSLRTLEIEAGTAILAFKGNTRAETASASGSLSLSGDGRISTLSIGAKTGQGAGDLEDRKDIILFVKDVAISNLNVKSPMTLNLATTVDSLSTSDAVTIGGEAMISALTLNPKANTAQRLLVDIVSANIQTVYANTPARINVMGASRINELTADASTYALGNKVNHLRVNADDVVYESEPDRITTASGVRPPQSRAENPNIDYNLGVSQATITDATEGDFATTCGHSRESGGFLVGDGSKDAPYEVSSAMQLAHVGAHLASHFVQTTEIDLSTESTLAANFPSIGGSGAPFEGVYDGRGYGISRLKIVSQAANIGLFGANKGMLQNVRVLSGDISAASTSQSFAGGIVGLNYDGGQIRSSANGAAVNGNPNTVTGGIAGGNFGGRIHDCYNYVKVEGVDIVGGIAGLNRQSGSITGSYNAGAINGRDAVGAVVGKNEDGTVANCYFLDTSSSLGIGAGSGTAIEKTSEELANAQMAADLSAGNESSLWTSGSTTGGYAYPVHRRPE